MSSPENDDKPGSIRTTVLSYLYRILPALLVASTSSMDSLAGEGAVVAIPAALADGAALQLETHSTLTIDKGTIGVADRGDVIAYVFAVTNSGTVTISDVTIHDRHGGAGRLSPITAETLIDDTPPYNDSSDITANDGKWSALGPGDTVIFAATYAVTQGDIDRQ